MEEANSQSNPAANQFSVSTILLLTTAVALLFGYARWLGTSSVGWNAAAGDPVVHLVVYLGLAALAGVASAIMSRNLPDAFYWTTLTSVLVYLAVAGGRLPSEAVFYGWGLLAAACGGLAAVPWPRSVLLGCIASGVAGSLAIVASLIAFQEPVSGLVLFDVLCGLVVGGLLRIAIEGLRILVKQSGHPPIAMAAWMSLLVLLGNFLVPIIGGVQR